MSRWFKAVLLLVILSLLLPPNVGLAQEQPAAPQQEDVPAADLSPAAVTDTPETLVTDPMGSYTIVSPKIFWQSLVQANCDPDENVKTWDDVIRRIAVQGSPIRTLYSEESQGSQCGPGVSSNVLSDGNYVYFVKGTFQRLPVTANPGDAAESTAGDMNDYAEMVQYGSFIYVLTETKGLWRVDKSAFTATQLRSAAQVGANPHQFQTDGEFLFWITGGRLRQMRLSNNAIADFAPTGVTNYTFSSDLCFIQPCSPDSRVYMGVANRIDRYKAVDRTFDQMIFTAASANDRFDEMVVSGSNLFF
ncbi:MAG: hypothetical protein R2873_27300, partial [Caldilineaceae bacterium]